MEKPGKDAENSPAGRKNQILSFLRSEEGWRLLKIFNVENDAGPVAEFARRLENPENFSTFWLTKIYRNSKCDLRKQAAIALRQRCDAAVYLADF
ncbi:MAG: hypothetical protein MUC28_03460 [Planctomycetes bacterium]|jgi:hypothetical protein|nr:hypothetical protein [Planctomycetota bacterium]